MLVAVLGQVLRAVEKRGEVQVLRWRAARRWQWRRVTCTVDASGASIV